MNDKSEEIEKIITTLLTALGQDTNEDALKDTPRRVARSYRELLGGYDRNFSHEVTMFDNDEAYEGIIFSGDINFFSTCEHHLLPFYGKAYIAYLPGAKIVGLSKLARVVDIYARRLQNQERITAQCARELQATLCARGVAVALEGKHFCNMARGTSQIDSTMKTYQFTGDFHSDKELQRQFMAMI